MCIVYSYKAKTLNIQEQIVFKYNRLVKKCMPEVLEDFNELVGKSADHSRNQL